MLTVLSEPTLNPTLPQTHTNTTHNKHTQTLPALCESLNPKLDLQTAHVLKLEWEAPDEGTYGKVASYQLCARMNWDPEDAELHRLARHDPSLPLDIGPGEWVVLYEGPTNSFCVGRLPVDALAETENPGSSNSSSEAEWHAPVLLLSDPRLAARREPYLPYELLPRNTAFDFRVTARYVCRLICTCGSA
jgi:hypothetical protein